MVAKYLTAILLILGLPLAQASIEKVVHGSDDRVESFEYGDPLFQNYAGSVAGMVRSSRLATDPEDPESYVFPKISAKERMNFCPDERFANQNTLPVCTGFLVAPDILVTAGHCMEEQFACKRYRWVFDFDNKTEKIAKNNVYKCEEILEMKLKTTFGKLLDYAVIKLNRSVFERPSLPFRRTGTGRVGLGTPLTVIGHPSGLPLKTADNASVKGWNGVEKLLFLRSIYQRRFYFNANLDTFGGNSGSPVFNAITGEVEGILIEGAEDFEEDKERGCLRSRVKSGITLTTSEKVYRMPKVDWIQENL